MTLLIGLSADRDAAHSVRSIAAPTKPPGARDVAGTSFTRRLPFARKKAHRESHAQIVWLSSDELLKRVIERQPVRRPAVLNKSDLLGTATIQVMINQRGRVISARRLSGNSASVASHIRSVRRWKFQPYRVSSELKIMAGPLSLRYDFQDEERSFCDAKLEQAEMYDIEQDPRAEGEYQRVLSEVGYQCPELFRGYSSNLSRNLKFREAAAKLQVFINLTPANERNFDEKEVTDLLNAAQLKERVDSAAKPELDDLLKLTHVVAGFSIRRDVAAMPYAEKAVELYPNSVAALLSLEDVVYYTPGAHTPAWRQRILDLLNRAAALEPGNPTIYSIRGMFYLDVFRKNERQKPDEAERDFRLALSLSNDSDPGAWRGMGYLYLFRGQRHDALIAFRKCALLTNNHPSYDVKEQIEILERFPH